MLHVTPHTDSSPGTLCQVSGQIPALGMDDVCLYRHISSSSLRHTRHSHSRARTDAPRHALHARREFVFPKFMYPGSDDARISPDGANAQVCDTGLHRHHSRLDSCPYPWSSDHHADHGSTFRQRIFHRCPMEVIHPRRRLLLLHQHHTFATHISQAHPHPPVSACLYSHDGTLWHTIPVRLNILFTIHTMLVGNRLHTGRHAVGLPRT